MNKTIPMTTKSGKRCSGLEAIIRKQFLGGQPAIRTPTSDLRVVLYSHDTMGIGHMRRNMLIANQIKQQFPNASVLTIAGAKEAYTFAQSANIDCLSLPSFQKRNDGSYESRSLGIPVSDVLEFRTQTILAAVKSFQPDLLIADKMPAGAGGELLPSLDWLAQHSTCHCVLGLRDILDSPETVIRDWDMRYSFEVIRRHFCSIWIYGDPEVYNAVREYEFPADIAERVIFTGYLDTRLRLAGRTDEPARNGEPHILCTVGGGQDGEDVLLKFAAAIRETGKTATLLTGPYLSQATKTHLFEFANSIPSLQVIEFVEEGDKLIQRASHVVSMGGYNTLAAILSHRKTALIVPRVIPREEQLIRANRLAELGLVKTIHPDNLTVDSIVGWLEETETQTRFANIERKTLDMDGLIRIGNAIHAEFPSAKYSMQVAPKVGANNES